MKSVAFYTHSNMNIQWLAPTQLHLIHLRACLHGCTLGTHQEDQQSFRNEINT